MSGTEATAAPVRRLTWLYVAALSFVAALSIAGQIIAQRSLNRQLDDSRVVNLAGRQRMLSQRLTQLALRLERDDTPDGRRAVRQEFAAARNLWVESHEGLRSGSAAFDLPPNDSGGAATMFDRLDATYLPMVAAVDGILEATKGDAVDRAVLSQSTQALLAREADFLAGMDAIVFQYDAEARARVANLRLIEGALLALTLATLAAEGLFVFRPAAAGLRRYVASLSRLNSELSEAQRRAEEANAAKTQFLAGMSHELRTPMNAILGASELALERAPDPHSRRLLSALHASATSLLSLLNDLLDLSRSDAGAFFELAEAPFRPATDLAATADLYRPSAEKKGLAFVCDVDPDLPAAVGDRDRIRQVASNLLSNAIKFTDRGSVTFHVQVERSAESDGSSDSAGWLRIDVADTGVGIAKADQARIFERFAQVDSSPRRRAGGAGLGLAISAELVAAMNGSIEVVSEPGQGSRFICRLPVRIATSAHAVDRDDPEALPDADPAPNAHDVDWSTLNVLVVDDSEVNRLLLSERLTDLGCRHVEAANGREAVAAAAVQSFDVALLDLEMPEMDGLAAARKLRQSQQKKLHPMRLVAVTAYAPESVRAECEQAGIDETLAKPVRKGDLMRALARAKRERTAIDGDGLDRETEAVDASPSEAVLRRFSGRERLLDQLIEIYLREHELLASRLDAAVARRDRDEMAFQLHRWKGASANFGYAPIVSDFAAAETALARDDADPAGSIVELRRSLDEFERALRAIGESLGGR